MKVLANIGIKAEKEYHTVKDWRDIDDSVLKKIYYEWMSDNGTDIQDEVKEITFEAMKRDMENLGIDSIDDISYEPNESVEANVTIDLCDDDIKNLLIRNVPTKHKKPIKLLYDACAFENQDITIQAYVTYNRDIYIPKDDFLIDIDALAEYFMKKNKKLSEDEAYQMADDFIEEWEDELSEIIPEVIGDKYVYLILIEFLKSADEEWEYETDEDTVLQTLEENGDLYDEDGNLK